MAISGRTFGIIVGSLIIIFGIIHLAVGISIAKRYGRYNDVFRQSVGLAIFNIIIGIFGIIIAIISLIAVIRQLPLLSKRAGICSLVLGIIALASLITALVLNSQSIGYIRARLTYRINSYTSIDQSINIVNDLQTNYECCGQYLWLDWATVALGVANGPGGNTGIGGGPIIGTGNGIGGGPIIGTGNGIGGGPIIGTGNGIGGGPVIGTGNGIGGSTLGNGRKRRQSLYKEANPLVQAIRRRRRLGTSNTIYGLPSAYSINLPLSCCKGGGTTVGNSLGGYCVFNAGNSTNNFYVGGCLAPVANIVVSQITGFAVMNVCLTILAFIFLPILTHLAAGKSNSDDKQNLSNETQPQQQELQQNANGGYYMNNSSSNGYYAYPAAMNTAPMTTAAPTHVAPMNTPATYTVYQ